MSTSCPLPAASGMSSLRMPPAMRETLCQGSGTLLLTAMDVMNDGSARVESEHLVLRPCTVRSVLTMAVIMGNKPCEPRSCTAYNAYLADKPHQASVRVVHNMLA